MMSQSPVINVNHPDQKLSAEEMLSRTRHNIHVASTAFPGYTQLFYGNLSHPSGSKAHRLFLGPGHLLPLYGTSIRERIILFGGEGENKRKIYYAHLIRVANGLIEEELKPLPKGKYCYNLVKISTARGEVIELRVKKAGTGSHWYMLNKDEQEKLPTLEVRKHGLIVSGAGEFLVDGKNQIVLGFNATGQFQSIPSGDQEKHFRNFFGTYVAADCYMQFEGGEENLVKALNERGLNHLNHLPELTIDTSGLSPAVSSATRNVSLEDAVASLSITASPKMGRQ